MKAVRQLRKAQQGLTALRQVGAPQTELARAQRLVDQRQAEYRKTEPGYLALPTEVDSRQVAMGFRPLVDAALKHLPMPASPGALPR